MRLDWVDSLPPLVNRLKQREFKGLSKVTHDSVVGWLIHTYTKVEGLTSYSSCEIYYPEASNGPRLCESFLMSFVSHS